MPPIGRAECLSMAERPGDPDRSTDRIMAFDDPKPDGTGFFEGA